MAINAKFQADFSGFIAAIDKADVALVDLSKGASKVEGSLNRMVDNFSGRKLIQEASLMTIAVERAGGVATLTARELEQVGNKANEAADKMRKLGYDVPQGLQKLADETRGATSKFSEMSGVVSQLAGAFGIAFSLGAVVNFGKALLANADSLVRLHDKTGVSIEGLQKFQIAGDDAGNSIEEITAAITKMEDKVAGGDASAAGALAKLGLSFADLKGMSPENQFIAISDAIRQIHDPAQQVNIAIDLFGKTGATVLPVLKRGFDDVKDAAVGMSTETARVLDMFGDQIKAATRRAEGFAATAFASFLEAARMTDSFAASITGATTAATLAAPHMAAIVPPGLPKDLGEIEAALDKGRETMVKTSEAAKSLAEAEKFMLGKTLDSEIAQNKAWVDRLQRTLDGSGQIHRVEADLADFIAKTSLSSLDYQVLKIWERVDEEERSFKGSEQQRAQYNAAVEALATEQAQALRNTADAAAAATEAAAMRQVVAIKAVTGSYWEQIDAAATAAGVTVVGHRPGEGPGINEGGQSVFGGSFTGVSGGATDPRVLTLMAGGAYTLGEAMAIIAGYGGSIGGPHPGRAGGGSVSSGRSYMVGERGPELFTPGVSGSITPNGGGGLAPGAVVINLYGTPAELVEKVKAVVLRTVMSGSKIGQG